MSKQIDVEKLWDNTIPERLRLACSEVRTKSYPLSDLIPLMQQAADHIAALEKDAARYQKLVQSGKFVPATLLPSCIWGLSTSGTHATKQELDDAVDAVDAAMEANNAKADL